MSIPTLTGDGPDPDQGWRRGGRQGGVVTPERRTRGPGSWSGPHRTWSRYNFRPRFITGHEPTGRFFVSFMFDAGPKTRVPRPLRRGERVEVEVGEKNERRKGGTVKTKQKMKRKRTQRPSKGEGKRHRPNHPRKDSQERGGFR